MPGRREIFLPIERDQLPVDHPLRLFDRYWRDLAAGGGLPTREAFNPLRVPPALPWLCLFEYAPRPVGREDANARVDDYVVLLFGASSLSDGGELEVGTQLTDLFSGESLQRRLDEFAAVHARREPLFSRTSLDHGPRPGQWIRGVFPFVSACGTPQVMVVMMPDFDGGHSG